MNLATTATPHRQSAGRRSWRQWRQSVRLPALLMSSVLLIAAVISYGTSTRVTGVEINCNDWQLRRFSFRRDPFTNYQWTGIRHAAPSTETVWTANASQTAADLDVDIAKYLPAVTSQPRWDVVWLSEDPNQGPGAILVELLSITDRDVKPFWPAWNKSHPAKAKILWPAAQDLVQFEMYADLPGLFELATLDLSASEFAAEVHQLMASALANSSHRDSTARRQRILDLAAAYAAKGQASPDSSARQDK